MILGQRICYCESYYSPNPALDTYVASIDDPPFLPFPTTTVDSTVAFDDPPWSSPLGSGVMASPHDTLSYSSGILNTPGLNPPNPTMLGVMTTDLVSPVTSSSGGSSSGWGAAFDDASTPITTITNTSWSEEGSSIGWCSPPATTPTVGRDTKYECAWTHCGKVFRRRSDLTKHERYHVKDFFCDEPGCGKAFATQKDLKRHKMTHEKVDDGGAATAGYRCTVPGCRKAKTGHVYNRRDNFARHLRTKHEGMGLDVEDFGCG